MPRGWHLAQGRALLTRSDNDDDEGPYEITNGQLVCSSHGRVISGMCCTDYSFRDDARRNRTVQAGLAHVTSRGRNSGASSTNAIRQVQVVFTGVAIMSTWDPDGEALCANITPPMLTGREKRRGTGRVFPTEFSPRSDMIKPTELFPGQANYEYPRRYIHRRDSQKVLVFTDGACLNNGQPNPRAGWAFVHGPGSAGQPAVSSGRLENKGPFGDPSIQSSNRAELRAVIAALRFQAWDDEGFKAIVVATDSEYVTKGSSVWAKDWVENGWLTSNYMAVKNKDLWEMLLGEAER